MVVAVFLLIVAFFHVIAVFFGSHPFLFCITGVVLFLFIHFL